MPIWAHAQGEHERQQGKYRAASCHPLLVGQRLRSRRESETLICGRNLLGTHIFFYEQFYACRDWVVHAREGRRTA